MVTVTHQGPYHLFYNNKIRRCSLNVAINQASTLELDEYMFVGLLFPWLKNFT